jgi:hypothetical protein
LSQDERRHESPTSRRERPFVVKKKLKKSKTLAGADGMVAAVRGLATDAGATGVASALEFKK